MAPGRSAKMWMDGATLTHIRLTFSIEKAFKVKFSTTRSANLKRLAIQ
jgi:hypothetical protein